MYLSTTRLPLLCLLAVWVPGCSTEPVEDVDPGVTTFEQGPICVEYLACVAAARPGELESSNAEYGPQGSCYAGDQDCEIACHGDLTDLREEGVTSPECWNGFGSCDLAPYADAICADASVWFNEESCSTDAAECLEDQLWVCAAPDECLEEADTSYLVYEDGLWVIATEIFTISGCGGYMGADYVVEILFIGDGVSTLSTRLRMAYDPNPVELECELSGNAISCENADGDVLDGAFNVPDMFTGILVMEDDEGCVTTFEWVLQPLL